MDCVCVLSVDGVFGDGSHLVAARQPQEACVQVRGRVHR